MKTPTPQSAAIVLVIAFAFLLRAAFAGPFGNLEGPRAGEIVAGVVNVWGWVTDQSAVVKVELGTDRLGYFADLGYGGTRNDVAAAYPDIGAAGHSGYAGALQTRHLPNGPVTLSVRATNAGGESTVFQQPIVVANPPESGALWDSVDLSDADVRILGQSIMLDNVNINGRLYSNVNLNFDPYTDAFRMAYFAQDLDGDGVPEGPPPSTGVLTAQEISDLRFMREEEQLARDVYRYLGALWGHSTFSNIAGSEQTHMDAVRVLIDRYGIDDPTPEDQPGVFANSDLQNLYDVLTERGSASLVEALRVGGLIEEVDIADLADAMAATAQADIRSTYENLSQGSENHLRAYANALSRLGVSYEAQHLDADLVAEILAASNGHGQGSGP